MATPTSEDPRRFLHPATIAKVGRLELRARQVVEGFISGLHKSPVFGHSIEFLQHREYTMGDDIRHLDWKVWSRTDRFHIKQYEEETNLTCHMLIDVSRSMGYASGEVTKLHYASFLTGALAYLMHRQRDAFGLIAFDDAISALVPASARGGHLRAVLLALERLQVGHRTNVAKPLNDLATAVRKRGMVVLVSDLLDDPQRVLDADPGPG